jgi:hypothetical protein
MKIIVHSIPNQESILVQSFPQAGETLFADGKLVTVTAFSAPKNTQFAAKKRTHSYVPRDIRNDCEITKEQRDKYVLEAQKQFGISISYNEDNDEVFISSQSGGVGLFNAFIQANYPYVQKITEESIEIECVENVAEDLGGFIIPLYNISGFPEVAKYQYNGDALRLAAFNTVREFLVKNKAIISSEYPSTDWSIFYYVVKGDSLRQARGEKQAFVRIGNKDEVLAWRKKDELIYEKILNEVKSHFASPSAVNKAIYAQLSNLIGIKTELSKIEVKQKSYSAFNVQLKNLQIVIDNVLESVK